MSVNNYEYHTSTRGITGLYHAKETEINTSVPALFCKTRSIYSIRAIGKSIQLTVLLEYIDLCYPDTYLCPTQPFTFCISIPSIKLIAEDTN